MKQIAAVCLALLFVSASCGDKHKDKNEQFAYPTQPGTTWYYTITSVRSFDTADVFDWSGHVTVSIVEPDTSPGLTQAVQFRSVSTIMGPVSEGSWFYRPASDGLYLVANCGSTSSFVMTPKRAVGAIDPLAQFADIVCPDMLGIAGCGEGAVDFLPDEPAAIRYPWRVGNRWAFRSPTEVPFHIYKSVIRFGKVSVPAGTFDCYRLRWEYEALDELRIEDDVADCGLVCRRTIMDSVLYTDYEHPEGNGQYFTWIQDAKLDSMKIPSGTNPGTDTASSGDRPSR